MNAKQTIGITLSTAVLALVMFTSWHTASLTQTHGTQLVAQVDGGPDGIDVDGGPDGGPLG
jgi:hypothetical protein